MSSQPTIYDLAMIIRGFSNEITARGLASRLGISYSTLARCKSGVWPRSITMEAMRSTFADCRDRYFDGDGEAIASSILMQLSARNVQTEELAQVLAQDGYEGFMSALLTTASQPKPKAEARSQAKAQSIAREDDATASATIAPAQAATVAQQTAEATPAQAQTTTAQPAPSVPAATKTADFEARGPRDSIFSSLLLHDLAIALPVGLILLVGMTGFSVTGLVLWASEHRTAFFVLSLAIALAPTLIGLLVDTPIAWLTYRKQHPQTSLTPRNLALVAKFGGTKALVPFAGRFNLTQSYACYQPVCNLLGMMCYVSLLSFLLTLPNFVAFLAKHEWVEFFKIGVVVAYYVSYDFMVKESTRPFVGEFGLGVCENPDNYLPSRFHVWANALHLVWTISLLIILLLGLVGYSLVNFRQLEAPAMLAWPYLQAVAFFAFADASPYAVRTRATAVGAFLPGIIAPSAAFVALALFCYLPSWGGAFVCLTCLLGAFATIHWTRKAKQGEGAAWIEQGHSASVYALAVTAAILCMLAIDIVALAL